MRSCIKLFAVSLGFLVATCSFAQDLTERDKERVSRLDEMARSLEKVKVDKVRASGNQQSEDRRFSDRSELHIRFLVCVAGLANKNQDGLLIFPLQVSGFKSAISASGGGKADRKSGADYQQVKVSLTGIRADKPKAKIDLPELRHGSSYNAVQLARDEIIERIRWFFPDAEIEGRQKFDVKRFAVRNETKEPIAVWLHYRKKVRKENHFGWEWTPSEPDRGDPIELALAPGKTEVVAIDNSSPIEGSHVQFWVESESGELWEEHRHEPLSLVAPNPELDGERAYYAERPQTHEFVVRPHSGKIAFTERVLELENATDESLDVSLQYYTSNGGKLQWRTAAYTLPPKNRFTPRDDRGMRLRASQMRVTGKTQNRRYHRHAKDPLWLVEEVDGRRAYLAEKVGTYQFVFTPTGESGGTSAQAQVSVASTRVMSGSTPIATLSRGANVEIRDRRPGWLLVRVPQGKSTATGWVRDTDIDAAATVKTPAPPAERSSKTFTVTASAANVQVGSAAIARLARGDRHLVLEERGGWARIEVMISGQARQGWVDLRYGQVR